MNNWTAAAVVVVLYVLPAVAIRYWWPAIYGIRRHRRIRAWRRRMVAMADRRFRPAMLTAGERRRLIGRGGMSSDQWFRRCAADYMAGRRKHMPTCGDYLAEFGRHPKVRAT